MLAEEQRKLGSRAVVVGEIQSVLWTVLGVALAIAGIGAEKPFRKLGVALPDFTAEIVRRRVFPPALLVPRADGDLLLALGEPGSGFAIIAPSGELHLQAALVSNHLDCSYSGRRFRPVALIISLMSLHRLG